MNRTTIAGLAVVLAVAAGGLYLGLVSGEEGAPLAEAGHRGSDGPLSIPAEVVDFATLQGDSASLEDYRGQVVLLNLWGTWCPPCRREIPDLVKLQERIEPRGGTVVGLAVDSGSPAEIRDFADSFEINYPVWHARTRTVVEHYRAMGFPTTLLVDREGIIRERYIGPQTAEELLADLEPYLEEGRDAG